MSNKTETMYRVTMEGGLYFGQKQEPFTYKVKGSNLDANLAEWREAGREAISVEQIPFCGWDNPWTDSGDRGAADADHLIHCGICVE